MANEHLLRAAIARNGGAVLSLPVEGVLRHHKSRLLAEHEGGVVLEAAPSEQRTIEDAIARQQPCGVAFKADHQKVIFAARIRRAEPAWRLSESATVHAVLIDWPIAMKVIQRRANFRVRVPQDADLSLRVWRMGKRSSLVDRPMPSQELVADLRDLSIGGIGVRFRPIGGEPPKVTPLDRLRVQIGYRDITLLLEGRMRPPHADTPDKSIISGISFRQFEDDMAGRVNLNHLTRIVGELQRRDVRNARAELLKSA